MGNMRAFHFILAITLSAVAASAAHAQTYRWIDETGAVQFSQELPPPSAAIQELGVVEGTATLSPFEQRALEIINEERRALVQERATAASEVSQPLAPDGSLTPSSSLDSAGIRARAIAARDPCLLSPDPRCFEKNARNYDPYLGYAPGHAAASADPGTAGAPVGTNAPGNAGGQVAGPRSAAESAAARSAAATITSR